MKRIILGVVLLSGLLISPQIVFADSLTDSVVKILVASNRIDYYRPWQSLGIASAAGSGVVIKGNKIITNAHVIANQTFVQVKKEADPKRYTARVVAIGNDCDLALLTIDDPHFFDGVKPLDFGTLPNLRDAVTVVGYPQGGDKLSVTEGVVSRIEVTPYSQSARQLLTVQIDAAINPGNSGGAVVKDGKLIGIAMQLLQAGQGIGYIIPMPIIEHFFNDLKDGQYDGFPLLGVDFDGTENPTLRDFYKMKNLSGGVLVTKVLPFTPADGYLKENDVMVNVDGIPVGEDGTFQFRAGERLSLTHIITSKQNGDDIKLKVMRDGKLKDIVFKLKPFVTLVPYPQYFNKPPYYIYGGLVFTVLSTDLLQSWGARWWEQAPLDFNYYLIGTGRLNQKERQEIVVLLNVLPDDINVGYHDISNEVVSNVNGKEFKSFHEFVSLLNQMKNNEKYTILETEHDTKLILNNENIDRINTEIIKRNNIPSQFSSDVSQWIGNN